MERQAKPSTITAGTPFAIAYLHTATHSQQQLECQQVSLGSRQLALEPRVDHEPFGRVFVHERNLQVQPQHSRTLGHSNQQYSRSVRQLRQDLQYIGTKSIVSQ